MSEKRKLHVWSFIHERPTTRNSAYVSILISSTMGRVQTPSDAVVEYVDDTFITRPFQQCHRFRCVRPLDFRDDGLGYWSEGVLCCLACGLVCWYMFGFFLHSKIPPGVLHVKHSPVLLLVPCAACLYLCIAASKHSPVAA